MLINKDFNVRSHVHVLMIAVFTTKHEGGNFVFDMPSRYHKLLATLKVGSRTQTSDISIR